MISNSLYKINMLSNTTTSTVSILITLATLLGVALHESKLDKLTTAAFGSTALAISHEAGGMRNDTHTHVERVSVQSAFTNKTPLNRMKYGEMKQHLLQQNVPRGHHAFDNYLLPVLG